MIQVIIPVKKKCYLGDLFIFYVLLNLKMKPSKSTYFAFFFLMCFLTSFSVITYKNINTLASQTLLKNSKNITVSAKEENQANSDNFLFEENETETENDFQVQAFTLPFFITFFQYESFQPSLVSAQPLAEKLTTPIYIEVCNFRI